MSIPALYLNIIKIFDLITFHIAIFMMKIHNIRLPSIFNTLFTPVNCVHSYNIRSAAKQSAKQLLYSQNKNKLWTF